MSVEWDLYRKCPVCFAELGKPCATLSGSRYVERDRPHGRRKLRTGTVGRG